jgi:hypothetical protein
MTSGVGSRWPELRQRYFHCCPAEPDPRRLLDREQQFTEPWGDRGHGPCDKCCGEGLALYECRSCLEEGSSADCPSCQGRVRYRETCPACLGSGEITHTRRQGIAVFPTLGGLYRYLAERGADPDGKVVVELEGRLSEERDLDADAGALLVHPERIVAIRPLDVEVLASLP